MFKLQIDTSNDAFQGDLPYSEIEYILRSVIDAVMMAEGEGICRDSNGNAVGKWSLDLQPKQAFNPQTGELLA